MSADLLIPTGITEAHEAAVEGLPHEVAKAMLEWASDFAASVEQMSAWGRVTYPEAFAAPEPEKPAAKRSSKRTKKSNKAEALTTEAPARANRNRGRRQDSSKARELETPPRAAVTESDGEPALDHSPDAGKMVDRDITLRLDRPVIAEVAAILESYATRRTATGSHACHADALPACERYAGLFRETSRLRLLDVTLRHEDWKGRRMDRVRRPGVVGLLLCAERPQGDRAGTLAHVILGHLREACQ